MNKVLTGIDIFCIQASSFKNKRFALVTNNVAATSNGTPGRIALLKAGINIVKLFSPEHGLNARGEDGSFQHNHIDVQTQLPVISLYGYHLMPAENELADIDIVLFDIPDVGCRFYTYLWTMSYVMDACAKFNKSFIVLDRPNPIGGNIDSCEGPMLDETNCSSFIGRWNMPVKHGCTFGELAEYFSATKISNLDLKVIKVQNWNRSQDAIDAGWQFIPTSPAIQHIETALLYPGMGMLEGINVNEGRGTASAFSTMGAPWLDHIKLNRLFNDLQLPGIKSNPVDYMPAWGLYEGEYCYGLRFSITNKKLFKPVKTGLALLQLVVQTYAQKCTERLYPTVANPSGAGHLDKLTGVYQSFEKLKRGEPFATELAKDDWKEIIQPYLLY